MTRATVRLRAAAALSLVIAAAGLAGTSVPVAAGFTCSVKNVTDSTSFGDVQSAVGAASKGDKLEIRGLCFGPVVINRSITLVGKTVGDVMAMITGQESVRPVEIATGKTVTIRNLEIGFGLTEADGGGILNRGTLTLTGVIVLENDAGFGGGIANDGSLVINGASSIRNNRATELGGGIVSSGPLSIGGTSVVADNQSGNSGGGVAQIGDTGDRPPLTIRDKAVIRGNEAWTGFGVYVQGTSVVLRDRASVRGNRSTGGEGDGAVYLNGGRLTMLGSASVRGNTGGWAGGIMGVAFTRPSSVTMKGSSVVKANTGRIGGIYVENGSILMTDSSSVRNHTATGVDSAVMVHRQHSDTSFTMKGQSRVIDNAVTAGFGAVTRVWCEGAKATLSGLSGRVIRNTPTNVKTFCP
jgi:hypothetical protein